MRPDLGEHRSAAAPWRLLRPNQRG